MFELRIIIFFSVLLYFSISIKAESQCGDWEAFNNKKCFKLFENNGLQTFEDAIKMCSQQSNDSSLVTITSEEEQRFLTTLIFITKEVVDNVWIGAKFTNSQYKLLNGMNLTFTNWAEGHPKNLTENCVQMHSDPESMGKWVDEFCIRKNLVLCEKLPVWSENYFHETVLNLLETVSNLEKSHQITISSIIQNEVLMKESIEKLKQNESTLQNTIKILSEKVVKLEKNESILKQNENIMLETIDKLKQNEVIMNENFEKLKENEYNLQETVKILSEKILILEKNESNFKLAHLETENMFKENLTSFSKSLLEKVSYIENNESNIQLTVNSLKQTIIPIGFIYVQFPTGKTPQELWSWMTWQDVTSSYAGLFFRAFGGNSYSFGSTQGENAPRITRVKSDSISFHSNASHSWESTIKENGWSDWVYTGGGNGGSIDISFESSGGEVRPRNTAIRIWKRYA